MTRKSIFKRLLSVLLVLVMVFQIFGTVFAETDTVDMVLLLREIYPK